MYTLALTLELLGEILIAMAVVRVHSHVLKEHKLDKDVYTTIKKEKLYAVVGISLMIVSFILQIYVK
ncbi:MAG: hypothetical protein ACI9GH_000048 [Candidatus Paceibacteria bacterium]|jgi:hypothetical protein